MGVIPGTEQVIRDSRVVDRGPRDALRASATVDMLIGHWTVGPAHTAGRGALALAGDGGAPQRLTARTRP